MSARSCSAVWCALGDDTAEQALVRSVRFAWVVDYPPFLAGLVRVHGSPEVRLSQIVAKLFPELEAFLLAERPSFEDAVRLAVFEACLIARSVEAACRGYLRVCGGA